MASVRAAARANLSMEPNFQMFLRQNRPERPCGGDEGGGHGEDDGERAPAVVRQRLLADVALGVGSERTGLAD